MPHISGGDESGPGSTHGVQSGAAADGARDRAGDKATTEVQGPSRRRGQRLDWWHGYTPVTAEAGTASSGLGEIGVQGRGHRQRPRVRLLRADKVCPGP